MKAIIVIDVPYITTEPCEIDELGLVADMHIRATTLCSYEPFDLKEVDVRPMPNRIDWLENSYNADWILYSTGWNDCINAIIGDTDGTKGEK